MSRLILISISWLFLVSAHAERAEFTIPSASQWSPQAAAVNTPGQIYAPAARGPKRFVFTHSFPLHSDNFARNLNPHLDEIQDSRARFLELFGVTHYQILNHEILEGKGAQVLHTQFVAPNGHIRQAIERQYVRGRRAFVVTYIEEVNSLTRQDLERINKTLDQFHPNLHAKVSALELFEMFIEKASATEAVNSTSAPEPGTILPDLNKLDISTGPLPDYCKEVPEEDRRTTNDMTAPDAFTAKDMSDCPGALKKGATDFIKMLDSLDRATDMYKGDQIAASIGSAATAYYNDPKGMTKKIIAGLFNYAKAKAKATRNLVNCVNAKAAIRSLCEAVPGLVAGGVAGKIAAGGRAAAAAADDIGAAIDSRVAKSLAGRLNLEEKLKPVASQVEREMSANPQFASQLNKLTVDQQRDYLQFLNDQGFVCP